MATFKFITTFNEVELDENNNFIEEYEMFLPHHDIISSQMEQSWNSMHMERFYDGVLSNRIESATMKCGVNSGISEAVISIKMKPGERLTRKHREAIVNQTSAQLSDGWGEGFFGYINIMTDGKRRFCAV